jgi:hypothetical protein
MTARFLKPARPQRPQPLFGSVLNSCTAVILPNILLFVVLCGSATGATFYVSLGGSDSNPGTQAQPWRTVGKAAAATAAGDTVIIGPGDYDEHVYETTSGTAGNRITYRAEPARGASLRGFRLRGAYVTLDGLKMTRYSGVGNTWHAATRIEAPAHNCIITNCVYADLPYVIAHDFRFRSQGNQIISPSSDFIAAGFVPGSQIYLGACGLNGLWYTNHDTTWVVASNTATTLWVTNVAGDSFTPDSGSNYWAVIRASASNNGFRGIDMVPEGGLGPTNIIVSGNLFSNWMGNAVSVLGRGHVLENNYFTKLLSFPFLEYAGDNHLIRSNIVKDSPNLLYYTLEEGADLVHPAGGGWYDYQVAMFSDSAPFAHSTNIVFAYNWLENLDNQLGGVSDLGIDSYGITFHNNVFVGISQHLSGGRDHMRWISNTFYRCAFESGAPLAIGGSPPQHIGYVLTKNLFIDCGMYKDMDLMGFYSVSTNALNPVLDFNMVAKPELVGYAAKRTFNEPNGVNGGDPLFLNPLNPLGPDGLPFTSDDGLQVLPNSPAVALGGGALGIYKITVNQPVAHFCIVSPQGWFEPVGSDNDPEWLAKLPTTRGRVERPHTTPPLLGTAPVTAIFDASKSLSGVNGAITATDISEYVWTFGSTRMTNSGPRITNTFNSAGTKLVHLTVKNTAGNTHTFSNVYRVAGTGPSRPGAPQNLRRLVAP